MKRREFITLLGGAAAAWPLAAHAQQAGKGSRIGYLGTSSPSLERLLVDAFRQKLRELVTSRARTSLSSIDGRKVATIDFRTWRSTWFASSPTSS
jgi:hypothetical protein